MTHTCEGGSIQSKDVCKPSNFTLYISNKLIIVCGDGKKIIGFEKCDDGNLIDGDGCSSGCIVD